MATELQHVGILGMRWGRRKSPGSTTNKSYSTKKDVDNAGKDLQKSIEKIKKAKIALEDASKNNKIMQKKFNEVQGNTRSVKIAKRLVGGILASYVLYSGVKVIYGNIQLVKMLSPLT